MLTTARPEDGSERLRIDEDAGTSRKCWDFWGRWGLWVAWINHCAVFMNGRVVVPAAA